MESETGLTRRQQERARKVLAERGVLETTVKGAGLMKRQTTHYRLDLLKLAELLDGMPVEEWGPEEEDDDIAEPGGLAFDSEDLHDIPF